MRAGRRATLAGALALAAVRRASAGTTVLRLLVPRYSAVTEAYFAQATQDFAAANPGLEIKVEVLEWDRLRAALAGGDNPDLAFIDTRWLPELVRQNRLEPLDAMLSGELRSRFIGAFLQPGSVGGKLYGLPAVADVWALFSNQALLARAAIAAPPTTWDAALADSLRLKAAGVRAFGLPGRGPDAAILWYCALWARGGELLGHDGRAAFATADGIAAMGELRALALGAATEDAPGELTAVEVDTMFARGQVAMAVGTPTLIDRLTREAPTLDYEISAVPRGRQLATYATTNSVVLFSAGHAKPAALHFVDYLFTRVPRLAFGKAERFLPTTQAVARDPFFAKSERLRAFTQLLPAARFTPTVAGWDGAATAAAAAVGAVLAGQLAAEPALQAAARQADAAMGFT